MAAPWEATASYGRGAGEAPEAIVKASDQVDLHDVELGDPYRVGIAMLPADAAIRRSSDEARELVAKVVAALDAGRAQPEVTRWCARVDELSRWTHDRIAAAVRHWLERDKLVGLVGGDHSTSFGSIAAHAQQHAGIGVLQVDAHADLREAYQGFTYSHASVMHQVLSELDGVSKLVCVGVRDLCEEERDLYLRPGGRARAFFDAHIARRTAGGEPFQRVAQQIAAELPEQVYVSFDIDGLDPSLCPHTGTPVPGGLSFHQAMAVLDAVVRSGRRIVGFDLCEVAPGPSGDEWDANVGARVLYKLIGYALRSRM